MRGRPAPDSLAVFTIYPDAIPAGVQLDIVFPAAGGRVTKPAAAAPVAGPASASPPAGYRARFPHPVAIRLIPAGQPQCPALAAALAQPAGLSRLAGRLLHVYQASAVAQQPPGGR